MSLSSCMSTTPMPCPKASHLIMNVLEKSRVARARVVHVASFIFSNALVATSFHWKDSFFNKHVRGDAMLPQFFTIW